MFCGCFCKKKLDFFFRYSICKWILQLRLGMLKKFVAGASSQKQDSSSEVQQPISSSEVSPTSSSSSSGEKAVWKYLNPAISYGESLCRK